MALHHLMPRLLKADDEDRVYFQVLGQRGEFVAGDADLPVPLDAPGVGAEVQYRDDVMRDESVRVAYLWLPAMGTDDGGPLVQIAETLELSAIICWTDSGSTAIRVARERPKPPVVAITPKMGTGRKLSLVWGVHCVVAEDAHDQDDMVERAGTIAFRDGFANAGQRVIIVAGMPLRIPGTTNMLRIASVEGPEGKGKA